jgi:hypothetical protein
MLTDYVGERFVALYAPLFDNFYNDANLKNFTVSLDEGARPIDSFDPRNFLLNLLDFTYKNLLLLTPRLNGLSIARVYTTVNGSLRVTYTVVFNYKDSRLNFLVDEPTLEAILPPP